MKDTDYDKLAELANVGGGFMPANERAEELLLLTKKSEIVSVKVMSNRDIKMHRCYMSLLAYIYEYLPPKFHKAIIKKEFYKFLKHLKKQYSVVYKFKDEEKQLEIIEKLNLHNSELKLDERQINYIAVLLGYTEMVEYESLSFGRMNQHDFKEYVSNQMPWIYENVIGKFFEGDMYDGIIETIEEEYKKFFSKLI